MSEISKYKNRFATTPIGTTSVDLYLDNIKDGTWQDFVLAVRNGKGNKDDAEGVTVSALFDANRRNDSVRTHSGFLAIDLDEGDNPDLPEVRGMLEADPYCYACHHSIRGFGLVWYVKISPEKHLEAFEAIDTGDKDIFHTAVFQLVHYRQPELGAFGLSYPQTKQLLFTVRVHAKGKVD